MKCERARELFSDYLEGGIDYALTETVRGHLDQCTACKHDFEGLKRTWVAMGALPEVEPPVDFRHNVIMQVARMQHEQTKDPRKAVRSGWSSLLQWLSPARAAAVAAGVLVVGAMAFRIIPITSSGGFSAGLAGSIGRSTESTSRNGAPVPTALDDRKSEWQNRKLLRNTIWTQVQPGHDSSGATVYRVALSINNNALVSEDVVGRVPTEVRLVPNGRFSMDGADAFPLVWRGAITLDQPVQVPVITDRGDAPGEPLKLLAEWRVRRRQFAQLIILPSTKISTVSTSVDTSGQLYPTLEMISRDYRVPVIVNAQLKDTSASPVPGDGVLGDELRKCLQSTRLDWIFADSAVYVDQKYAVPTTDD